MYIEKTADISNMYSHTAILKLFYNTVVVLALCGTLWRQNTIIYFWVIMRILLNLCYETAHMYFLRLKKRFFQQKTYRTRTAVS